MIGAVRSTSLFRHFRHLWALVFLLLWPGIHFLQSEEGPRLELTSAIDRQYRRVSGEAPPPAVVAQWSSIADAVSSAWTNLAKDQQGRALTDFEAYMSIYNADVLRNVSQEQAATWISQIEHALLYLQGPDFTDIPPPVIAAIVANSQTYNQAFLRALSDALASSRIIRIPKNTWQAGLPAWKAVALRGFWETASPPPDLFTANIESAPRQMRNMAEVQIYLHFSNTLAFHHYGLTHLLNNIFFAPSARATIDAKTLATYPDQASALIRRTIGRMTQANVFSLGIAPPRIGYAFLRLPDVDSALVNDSPLEWVEFPR